MRKKILVLILAAVVLVSGVLLIRRRNASVDTQAEFKLSEDKHTENDSLTQVFGSGNQLLQENERLALYLDFDSGHIEVVNKVSGYTWRSRPTKEEMALETSNQLWKNNLESPVVFAYTNSRASINFKYANTLSEKTKLSIYQLEEGRRVFFEFPDLGVTFGYDIALKDNYVYVDIPHYLITDPGEVYTVSSSGISQLNSRESCLVIDFFLFPSFGATRSDMGNQGYLLVPDGEGALMRFDTQKPANNQFIARVYGTDMALYNGYDQQLASELDRPVISLPAFGVVRDGNTLLAIIENGETQAEIVASRAQVQTGFNTVNARFTHRMKYKTVTNLTTGDGYLSYTAGGLNDSRGLRYYFGTGSYVQMAQIYRGYLAETYNLKKMDAEGAKPLQLYIVSGDVQRKLTGEEFIPMTTFQQAEDILRDLRDSGIQTVDAVLTGWAKRGESVQYPDRFPAAGALGGDAGLIKLTQTAKEIGHSVYLIDSSLMLYSHKGIRIREDSIFNIQNNPLFDGNFANARRMQDDFASSLPIYKRYGVSGIQQSMLGWLLLTDYSQHSPTTREQMKQVQRKLLQTMIQELGQMRLDSCHVYGLIDGMTLVRMPGSSYLTIIDENVPFYSIALHGLVDYVYGDWMGFYEPDRQMLDAVSKGGSISFTVSWEPTEKLQHAAQARYFSTQYSVWKDDIIRIYDKLKSLSEKTRSCFIIDFVNLSSEAVLTTYDNGVRVLVNYSMDSMVFEGEEVGPMDFLILEGGGNSA